MVMHGVAGLEKFALLMESILYLLVLYLLRLCYKEASTLDSI